MKIATHVILIIVFIIIPVLCTFGQCPTAGFSTSSSSICSNEQYTSTNSSINATSYNWDFCSGDLSTNPLANNVLNESDFFRARSLKIIKDGVNWYGFSISASSNILMRLDFGNSLTSIPTYNNLGNIENSLSSAYSIDIIKSDDIWHILVANGGNKNILLYSFNKGISSEPTSIDVVNTASLLDNTTPNNIKIVNSNGLFFGFITTGSSSSNSNVIRLDFGNSINNNPASTELNIDGANLLRGIDIIKQCNNWYGFVVSQNTNELIRIDFTNDLTNNTPISSIINTNSTLNHPINIEIINEGGKYYGLMSNQRIESDKAAIYKIDFMSDISNIIVTTEKLSYTELTGGIYALDIITTESNWFAFTFNLANRNLLRFDFENNCSVNQPVSVETEPINISYQSSGSFNITLTAFDANGNSNSITKSITVTSNTSPDIAFTSQNICAQNPIDFTSTNTSGDITSYAWDFGDTNTATTQNPSNTYTTNGTYDVNLTVTSSAGCTNSASKSLKVFTPPVASFDLPSGSVCTNDNKTFTNTTTNNFDGNLIYDWQVDATSESTNRDFSRSFSSSGNSDIKLTTSIPGCSSNVTKNVQIFDGPTVDFTLSNNCQGVSTEFTNQTTGDNITSYAWDFGNTSGNSTDLNPNYLYPADGTFNVKLDVTNQAGCVNTNTKSITIYKKAPTPVFTLSETIHCKALSETYTNSTDETGFSTGELTYEWNFNNEKTSNQKDTTYSFSTTGSKQLTLKTTTNNSCEASTIKNITVNDAPLVDFSLTNNCQGVATPFTNQTTGDNITNYSWNFGNVVGTSTDVNPNYLYPADGTFDVKLDVTNAAGCVNTNTKSITIYKKAPTPSFTFSETVHCKELTETYANTTDETGFATGEISYQWNFDNERASTQKDTTYAFTSIGVKQITLTSTTTNNCEATITQNITVNENSAVDFLLTDNCQGVASSFNNQTTGVGISGYAWSFGDGIGNSNDFSPSYTYPNDGSFSVNLEVTNLSGCKNEKSKTINILKAAPTPVFTLSESVHCTDLTETLSNFTDDSNFNTDEVSYIWEFDGAQISDQKNVTHAFSTAGTGTLSLIATTPDNCESTTNQDITINEKSIVDFQLSNNCQGEPTPFTNLTTGVNLTDYSWDFGDGLGTSSSFAPSYEYANDGDYSINLTVTNEAGCVNNASKSITIYKHAPSPVFSISESVHCTGTSEILTNSTDESNFNPDEIAYTWSFDNEMSSNQKDTTYTFNSPGTKTISLTTNTLENCTATTNLNIEVNESPSTAFQFSDNCFGETTSFTNLTTGPSIDSYLWDFGDGTTNSNLNPSHTYTSAGTYDVTLTSTSTSTCATNLQQEITIHATPIVNFTSEVACEGQAVNFFDASSVENANITNWEWNFDGLGSISGDNPNPSFTFSSTGNFDITLTTTSNFGCTASKTQTITINPSPNTQFETIIGCLNTPSTFTDITNTVSGNPIVSWFWEVDNQIYTTQNIEHVFTQAGEHDISLTVTPENACAVILSKQITINSLPEVNFSFQDACDNQFTTFTDESTSTPSPIISRTWGFNGSSFANGNEASRQFTEPGIYDITLTVITEENCTNQVTQQVEINQSPIADFIPSTTLGPPQLEVLFSNNSTNANSYQWSFKDINNTVLIDEEPKFIFTELGNYDVELIAKNAAGCSDTTSNLISVVDPDMNISLSNIQTILDNGNIRLSLTVVNEGTIDVDGFDVKIELDNEISLIESYQNKLIAKESTTFTLNFEIPATNSNIGFVCFTIQENDPDYDDTDLSSNEGCINFEQEAAIENPFPNPTTDRINLNMILPAEATIDIGLLNSYGKIVYSQSFSNLKSGLNQFTINTANFKKGIYFLRIIHSGKEEIRRVVKY